MLFCFSRIGWCCNQVALLNADTSIEQVFVGLEPLHQFAPILEQKHKNSDSDKDEQRESSPGVQSDGTSD
jgi:hypothetical protein